MKTYKIEFKNNKAVSCQKINSADNDITREFGWEGNKRVIKWCIIEVNNDAEILTKADKFVKNQWGYALGLK